MTERIPANGSIDVLVGQDFEQAVQAGCIPPYAVIAPDRGDWNDYGYRLYALLYIQLENRQLRVYKLRLMFENERRTSEVLDRILHQNGGQLVDVATVAHPFVSLLPDVDNYRAVIQDLGFDIGVPMLRKLHDVSVMKAEATGGPALALFDKEAFHVGILRSPGANDSFYRGGRHLSPKPLPITRNLSGTYLFTAKLPNADQPHELEFEFTPDPIFKDRACVLIGKNGTGKTHLLKAVVESLMDGEDDLKPAFEPRIAPSRVLVFSSVPTDPFPKSIPAWKGIDYEYFAINSSVADAPSALIGSLLTCWRDRPDALTGGGRWSRYDVLARMLQSLGIENRLFFPVREPDSTEELPTQRSTDGRLLFPFSRNLNELGQLRLSHRLNWGSWPVVLGENLEVRALSSGEHALLRLSAQMAAAVEQGSLLLLDEPETHLHPNYVSEFMSVLHELLEVTSSAAIIATHSSYVVREVDREKVNVIKVENRIVECVRPRMQTFAASIDNISQFVFDDADLEHRFQQTLGQWLDREGKSLSIDQIIERFGNRLNSEALSFIARRLRNDNVAS